MDSTAPEFDRTREYDIQRWLKLSCMYGAIKTDSQTGRLLPWVYHATESQLRQAPYSRDPQKWGKWMLFYPIDEADAAWNIAKTLYDNGDLVGVSAMKASASARQGARVIICYCEYLPENPEICKTIGCNIVQKMRYSAVCYYKLDATTIAGEYSGPGRSPCTLKVNKWRCASPIANMAATVAHNPPAPLEPTATQHAICNIALSADTPVKTVAIAHTTTATERTEIPLTGAEIDALLADYF